MKGAIFCIGSIAHEAMGLIVLVSPNQSDRKANNKIRKYKLKKYLFGKKTGAIIIIMAPGKEAKEKPANFATRWLLHDQFSRSVAN